MKNEKRHFVFVLPGDVTIFRDVEIREAMGAWQQDTVRQEAQRVVYAAKLTTPRKNPQAIKVLVREQTIKEGKLVETPFAQLDVDLPLEPMTGKEFTEEMDEILGTLPVEFHPIIRSAMEDRGESYETKVSIAREMAGELLRAVAEYTERIRKR